jgi:hypothetical protein
MEVGIGGRLESRFVWKMKAQVGTVIQYVRVWKSGENVGVYGRYCLMRMAIVYLERIKDISITIINRNTTLKLLNRRTEQRLELTSPRTDTKPQTLPHALLRPPQHR